MSAQDGAAVLQDCGGRTAALKRKTAYFERLKTCSVDDDEEAEARERRDRRLRWAFFEPAQRASSSRQDEKRRRGEESDGAAATSMIPEETSSDKVKRGRGSRSGTRPDTARGSMASTSKRHALASEPRQRPIQELKGPRALKRLRSEAQQSAMRMEKPVKRTKRDSSPMMQPVDQQILQGLAFFYIPDNAIAPARRLRINKAKEYGAVWSRDLSKATHVVVDKSLTYNDVEKTISKIAAKRRPLLVNEDYPIDCCQFRILLDPEQSKYQVIGCPSNLCHKMAAEEPTFGSVEVQSLQLKPKATDPRRWDYVPELGTPLRSGEDGRKQASQKQIAAADVPSDELSSCIAVLQEYKGLPLDDEDETGGPSSLSEGSGAVTEPSEDGDSGAEADDTAREGNRRRKGQGASRKSTAFAERFACHQAGEREAAEGNPNARTIAVLQKMADYYDRIDDHWRRTGYRKAISTLKRQEGRICTEEEAFRLPHVGRRIAQKIEEIVTTDRLRRLEYAEGERNDQTLQMFLRIYGVGCQQARQWIARGYRTLEDLLRSARLTRNQRIGIEHYEDLRGRIPREEVEALGAVVVRAAARIDKTAELIIGGSYRRGAPSSHDIDLIVTKPGTKSTSELRSFLDKLVDELGDEGFLVARLASSRRGSDDGSKWHGCCVLPASPAGAPRREGEERRATWRRIDFLLVPATELGAALLYFTGNDIFNRSMRLLASRRGMRLNQRGLFKDVLRGPQRSKLSEGQLLEGRDERRIFEILGVTWREPHERRC